MLNMLDANLINLGMAKLNHMQRIKSSEIPVLSYYKKTKKDFSKNLDINVDVKSVTDTKQYWKTVRLCLTKKTSTDGRITLIENEKVTSLKFLSGQLSIASSKNP